MYVHVLVQYIQTATIRGFPPGTRLEVPFVSRAVDAVPLPLSRERSNLLDNKLLLEACMYCNVHTQQTVHTLLDLFSIPVYYQTLDYQSVWAVEMAISCSHNF